MQNNNNDNDILFEEDTHTYTRNGANYISVTTLLKNYGLSAQYSAQIPNAVMKQAATRGTNVHKALENFIKQGIVDTTINEVVTFEKYITNQNIDLQLAVSEEVVYNNKYLIAGTIDFQYFDSTNTYVIADFKTTSSIHWESVAWQLSIYNYIKCNGDLLEYYTNKLLVYHMRNTKLSVREVPLIDFTEVEKLLQANLMNAPYTYHPDLSKIISKSEGVVLQQLCEEIEQYTTILKELQAKKEKLTQKIMNNMVATSTPAFITNGLKITYSPVVPVEKLDGKKVKQFCEQNNIDYSQFISISNRKETLYIKPVKQGDTGICLDTVNPLEFAQGVCDPLTSFELEEDATSEVKTSMTTPGTFISGRKWTGIKPTLEPLKIFADPIIDSIKPDPKPAYTVYNELDVDMIYDALTNKEDEDNGQ